jgi:hypothetical protein
MTEQGVVAFIRRGRARLEVLRLSRAAARGALLGGAVGLLLLLADRIGPGLAPLRWISWACLVAGAAAGALVATLRGRIGLSAAALFLDQRLATQERLVTLLTRDPGRYRDRLLRELGGVRRLPRLPLPREVSLVPAALFLLFAVGLLPRVNGAETGASGDVVAGGMAEPAADGAQAPKDIRDAIGRLVTGAPPPAAEADRLERAIERYLSLPEERRAAREALRRAAAGDAAAAQELSRTIEAAMGGRGGAETDTGTGTSRPAGTGAGGATVTMYPEHAGLVLAYRRALTEETDR